MSHTPGPWRLHDYKSSRGTFITVDADAWQVCELRLDTGPISGEANLANARLIVAAPELLERLKEAHKVIQALGMGQGGWAWEEVLDDIDSAIAKAEGK